MTTDLDLGARCDQHVGEVFRPRCLNCDLARTDGLSSPDPTGIAPLPVASPGTECPLHAEYPLPCARCARDTTNTPGGHRAT